MKTHFGHICLNDEIILKRMSEFGVRAELCMLFNILHPTVVKKCHLMCADVRQFNYSMFSL